MTTISTLVEITQEDWDEAHKMFTENMGQLLRVCRHCPVARAICRATGREDWIVFGNTCTDARSDYTYILPTAAKNVVDAFDNGERTHNLPITFPFTYTPHTTFGVCGS